MSSSWLTSLLFLIPALSFGQIAPQVPATTLPKDPTAIFAMAGPLYDFASPTLKPWHLKATYQLYNEKGRSQDSGDI